MSTVRYLADHDIRSDIVLAVWRLDPAIEFRTVREFGLAAAADHEILSFASGQEFIIVSDDVSTMKFEAERRIAKGLTMRGLFLVPHERLTRIVSESLHLI